MMSAGRPLMSAGRPLVTLLMMLLMVGPCTNRTVCGVTPWELESASAAEATSSRGSPSAMPVAHLPHHRPCGALLIVQARAPSAGRPLMASMMIVAPPLLLMVTRVLGLRFAKETS